MCYICSEDASVRIEYIDETGKRQRELRCEVCAEAVRNNEDREVIAEESLSEQAENTSSSSGDTKGSPGTNHPRVTGKHSSRTSNKRRRSQSDKRHGR